MAADPYHCKGFGAARPGRNTVLNLVGREALPDHPHSSRIVGPVLPEVGPIRWAHVVRAVYEVEQSYRYQYSEPVKRIDQRLLMVPRDTHGSQRLLDYQVSVAGAQEKPEMLWQQDEFGNRICSCTVRYIPEMVTFHATYRVERRTIGRVHNTWSETIDPVTLKRFLEPTPLTLPDSRLEEVADRLRLATPTPSGRAYRAFNWAAAAIAYKAGVTGVGTTAAEALDVGQGVCQDFAHIMVALLRLIGIPARYVSGHLLGRGAPHAWVEALLPDRSDPGQTRVVAYDPANRAQPGLNYIVVGVGRDFADMTPTSGTFWGHASSTLDSEKRAQIIEAEHDEE